MPIPNDMALTLFQFNFDERRKRMENNKTADIIDIPKNEIQISDNTIGISKAFPTNIFNGPKKQSVKEINDDANSNEAILNLLSFFVIFTLPNPLF
jgi:hypothetical protein